jgi:hypothetical protein
VDGAHDFLQAGDLLDRRRVVLTQLGLHQGQQFVRVAVDIVVPPGCREPERAVQDQRPGSLRSCCREDDGGGAAVTRGHEDRFAETGGVHDGLDLGCSIFQRANVRDRVRHPNPGLIKQEHATERGELVEEGLKFGHGPAQLHMADERCDDDQLDRPVAKDLIRQAQVTAGCVERVRHRMSVLLIPPLGGAPVTVRPSSCI